MLILILIIHLLVYILKFMIITLLNWIILMLVIKQ